MTAIPKNGNAPNNHKNGGGSEVEYFSCPGCRVISNHEPTTSVNTIIADCILKTVSISVVVWVKYKPTKIINIVKGRSNNSGKSAKITQSSPRKIDARN